ncbi:MAG: hypothetical protein AAF664_13690 [Planctomycetota bacterium]
MFFLTTGFAIAAASLRLGGRSSPVGLALSTATMALIMIAAIGIVVFFGGWIIDRVVGSGFGSKKARPPEGVDE